MAIRTPINGETWIPQLLVDYFTAQRANLGLPSDLNLRAWPFVGKFVRPYLGFEASTFRLAGHPSIQVYDVSMALSYEVDEDPELKETDAAAQTRRQAILTTETGALSLARAALSLRYGETLSAVGTVKSLFDWAGSDRTVPTGEDYYSLEDFIVAQTGGSLSINAEKATRTRITHYTCRIVTNEFTPGLVR